MVTSDATPARRPTRNHTNEGGTSTEGPPSCAKGPKRMTDTMTTETPTHVPTRTQVILDTSALVADPEGIFVSYDDVDLVVPLIVIEELDGLKKRLDPVGAAARQVIRSLEQFRSEVNGDLRTPVSVGKATIRIEINGVHVTHLREHGLDVDKADNRIIGAAIGLKDKYGTAVTVVSNDAALRVKAAALGLAAVEHDAHAGASMGHRPIGWVESTVSPAAVNAFYAGEDHEELTALEDDIPANQFTVLKSGQQSALAQRTNTGFRCVPNDTNAWDLRPRNKEQRFALELLLDPSVQVICLDGPAGTGKTLLAVAAGLEQVVNDSNYKRVCVYRPVVPVGKADLGYLPGTLDEKTDPYMAAITDAVYALTERRDETAAQNVIADIKARGQLTMESVAHLRGRTLHDAFIIVDEAQNLTPQVGKTLLTRVGENSKIVFTGDTAQIDAAFLSESTNALSALVTAFVGQDCFGQIRLTKGERSKIAELAATLL